MSEPTFVDLWLSGQVQADDIDDFVDAWHSTTLETPAEGRVPLHEYLGMTREQYYSWVKDPDSLLRAFSAQPGARTLESDRAARPGSVGELLVALRATAIDKRDQGDKFERLILAYLRNDPEWTARFSEVWLWSDWPGREGRPDTGIDLVAKNRDRDDFTAIQCKFYAPGHKVAKSDIDSFISASARAEFSNRIIFDTASGWSGNAEDTLVGVAQRIDVAYLEGAAFDWSRYSWSTPEVLVPTGKKSLRPHQMKALLDVSEGLASNDRGKMIMACGTGKTFTSLRIAEHVVGTGGSVLFLVPSIQLLSQSLREWMAEAEVDIRPFAVCSDVRVGRRVNSDDSDMSIIDLTEPATTDASTLIARMALGKHASERMTVVFATYQSIDVVASAQGQGLGDFDLVICDEAHRTTGVTLATDDESAFVRVHDNNYLRANKRLYMTATPKVFGEEARRRAADAEALLTDMEDETKFGPELHRLGFGEAVEADLLTDYKVLVLAVDENYVAENFQNAMAVSGEIALGDAAKLIGCWNGLAKNYGAASQEAVDPLPMRRAVAFAKDIKASKTAASSFPILVDRALQDEATIKRPTSALRVEAQHVDGTMSIHQRNAYLAWLKADTPSDVCRVLSNARCLSEGVDVPALDAVMFLTPRGSQVDVVQSVGRVMRKAPGKELGYIILPIVVPSGVAPEEALKDNERYRVVWQVLQALRSHDDRFHAMVNQIELNKHKSPQLVIDNVTPRPEVANAHESLGAGTSADQPSSQQLALDYAFDGFRDAMYARIVQKVGERTYWADWAKSVADIAQAHITRINALLTDPTSPQSLEFEVFLDGLRGNLNERITRGEAVEMLAQHIVTRPVFEALFGGRDFGETNPVARTMDAMLRTLDEHNLEAENATLRGFYESVHRRLDGIDNAAGKQRVLAELYEKFFKVAFSSTAKRLGIVYTPVQLVDFILKSADDVLRAEFGQGLTDEDVHVLDGFTGTGTFIVRLLQSGLIGPHDLARKYAYELHANELLLLAYYIAEANMQTTYMELTGDNVPFPGLILTDTFQSWEPDDRPDLAVFPENNARIEHLKSLPITCIVGNPPYVVGKDTANDDSEKGRYPALDEEIQGTYLAAGSREGRSLYDAYIRAIKWATLRIQDRGVIAFVTNGGFIDSATADGMRLSLPNEFTSIYVYNLRGNAMGAGDARQREGGGVFKEGSRTTVAVTVLVKNPAKAGPATVNYYEVGDYLTADEKLTEVERFGSILAVPTEPITPNRWGDWINQRSEEFLTYLPMGDKDGRTRIFGSHSLGIGSNRDAWVYNSSASALAINMKRAVATYQRALAGTVSRSDRDIKWTATLDALLKRRVAIEFDPGAIRTSLYRPFFPQFLYADKKWIHRPGEMFQCFPSPETDNLAFVLTGVSSHHPFSALAVNTIPDKHALDSGQFFSRWRYVDDNMHDTFALDQDQDAVISGGYRRVDNITNEALTAFRNAYPNESITKDDIFNYVYGVLSSPHYTNRFKIDLKKGLPRIPFVTDFWEHANAGARLIELHTGYGAVDPYPLGGLDIQGPGGDADYSFFAVGSSKMRYGGNDQNRTSILFNSRITLTGVPAQANEWMLGPRTAVEWMFDRYYVSTDAASGISNDPNDWSREVGNPRHILDLLARIVTVSVETIKILDGLPDLNIIEGHRYGDS